MNFQARDEKEEFGPTKKYRLLSFTGMYRKGPVYRNGHFEGLGKNYRNSILSQKLIYFFRMISGKSEFGMYAG